MHEQDNSSAWKEMHDFSARWTLLTKMQLGIISVAAKALPDLVPKLHDP